MTRHKLSRKTRISAQKRPLSLSHMTNLLFIIINVIIIIIIITIISQYYYY